MNSKSFERWAPWLLLLAVIVLWQVLCTVFKVSEFIFPSPL
ncbi:MAG: ABC transporter permease, partial [Aquabacterium sp.]